MISSLPHSDNWVAGVCLLLFCCRLSWGFDVIFLGFLFVLLFAIFPPALEGNG